MIVGYAYPWDVNDDPGFAPRAAEIGVDHVAIAASYHTVRAATPWHPHHVMVDASWAAFYRPVRSRAWGRLVPSRAPWTRSADSFGGAARSLAAEGMPVTAWVVLTHNTALGAAHPDLTVRNCFGDHYPYALCPAHHDVVEYSATLVAETVRDLPLAGVCLEACGQFGVAHGGHHDKIGGAFDPHTMSLLSVCCCDACARGWNDDPDRVRAVLRAAVRGEAPLDEGLAEQLLAARHRTADGFREAVLAAAGDLRVTLHGDADPWSTGSLPGFTGSPAVAALVTSCWPVDEGSVERVRAARCALDRDVSIGAYVTCLGPEPAHVSELAAAGADELHLYHLGLAGPPRQDALRRAVLAFDRSPS